MHTIEHSINRIITWMQDEGISAHRLSTMANLGKHTLRHIGEPEWNPTRKTIQAIEVAMEEHADKKRRGVAA